MNAVADVMADKYNTTKGGILDGASSSSLAVRMALGETQVVTETRKFLVSQGVKLDAFGQVCFLRTFLNISFPCSSMLSLKLMLSLLDKVQTLPHVEEGILFSPGLGLD